MKNIKKSLELFEKSTKKSKKDNEIPKEKMKK